MKLSYIAILALPLFAASAAKLMPPGDSPESGMAGTWRVIAARSAPWAKPHKLSKADAPLLEFALTFADRKVDGPAPLGCPKAQYTSGVTYRSELFGGRFAHDANGVMAKAVRLSNPGATTFRVICDNRIRDYYIDDNADMLTAEGDVLYTLQRPSGTPEETAGFSGPGFECTKAKTAGEQLICSDAALSKADRTLNAAYARLKKEESPASFAAVQAAQRAWLAYVLSSCAANGKMPEDQGARNDLTGCLTDNYTDRAERLDNAKVAKAGGLTLEPRMRLFSKRKPDTEDSDIYPWMAGGAQAAPFNAWTAKVLQLGKRRMDDRTLFAFTDLPESMKLYARRTYSVIRFDANVVSLQVSTYDYSGGAHEILGERSLNWDMKKSHPFAPADALRPGWQAFVTDYCLKDLHRQFASQQESGPDRASVEAVVRDPDNWLWDRDHAIVHFSVYTVASFAGGEFDVEIPYRVLKPLLKPDALVAG